MQGTRDSRVVGSLGDTKKVLLRDNYRYDESGNRISHTNALGFIDETYFDALGRVRKTVSAEGNIIRYDYAYNNSIASLGGALQGGYQKTTTFIIDAATNQTRTTLDNIDYFGGEPPGIKTLAVIPLIISTTVSVQPSHRKRPAAPSTSLVKTQS